MKIVKNLLALVGLAAIVVGVYACIKAYPEYKKFQQLDPKAAEVYREMFDKLLATGNSAEATVWKVQVDEGLTAKDVEETMRFAQIYMFCNAMTAARMMDYSNAYSAYLPCRVSMVKDNQGRLWIYSLNMDLMIYGGKPLPPDLKKEAMQVKEIILDIMNRGAHGEF
jgi:uncharacterized protein (DUF302 family)